MSENVYEDMDCLRNQIRHLESQLTDLQTKLDKAREALRPFKPVADWFPKEIPDSEVMITGTAGRITLGDLRLAAKTLDEINKNETKTTTQTSNH
jgi:hypothetical protein